MASNEIFLLHICPNCSGRIEFPSHGLGEEIDCPHCTHRTVLREQKQPQIQHAAETRRSLLPIGVVAAVAVLALFALGTLLFAGKEKQKARQEMKAELVALKVGLRDGLSLTEIRSQRKKLNVVFELKKNQLPAGFSLARLNLCLEASGYFWEREIKGSVYLIKHIDATWMQSIIAVERAPKSTREIEDLENRWEKFYLNLAKLALARDAHDPFEVEWDVKAFTRKSLERCGEEVEQLLAKLE